MDVCTIKVLNEFTNCYLLIKGDACLIVDPGADFYLIKEKIGKLKPLKILLTHSHYDHTGAISDLIKEYNIDVLSFDSMKQSEYEIGPFTFEIIKTPGHTSDSITFYFAQEKTMFTGDFLFFNDIGRTDLATSSDIEMKKSIELIKTYPKDVLIYPGHDAFTTLEDEINNNPYF